jgi:ornithine carbamoyltransferase
MNHPNQALATIHTLAHRQAQALRAQAVAAFWDGVGARLVAAVAHRSSVSARTPRMEG